MEFNALCTEIGASAETGMDLDQFRLALREINADELRSIESSLRLSELGADFLESDARRAKVGCC